MAPLGGKGGKGRSVISPLSVQTRALILSLRREINAAQESELFLLLERGHVIDKEEVEKSVRWIRKSCPDLFWTALKEGMSKLEGRSPETVKSWEWIQTVHAPATNTVAKFMGKMKELNPLDYIALRGKDSDLREMNTVDVVRSKGPYPRVQFGIAYLKKVMTGVLLGHEKQKGIEDSNLFVLFEKFYEHGLNAMVGCKKERHFSDEGQGCEFCGGEDACVCHELREAFEMGNLCLHLLGLLDELAGPRLYVVIKRAIAGKIAQIDMEKMDESNIAELRDWMKNCGKEWYTALYLREPEDNTNDFEQELNVMLMEQYGMAIVKHLFSVIIEFPDSYPLLDDLIECMKHVALLRGNLVADLRSTLEKRLLNAGVNTSEVLEAYIATVRALNYIDMSGILVQLVTPPVREYLKHREETVRVILISLTDEAGELAEELVKQPVNPEKKSKQTYQNFMDWQPDPIDVPQDLQNLRKADLIETMVSIYGSKSVFIDEYRGLLADRLLRMPKPGSITREIKCLELLKLRFGEADLQKCEVMLKDVSDSQRLNTRFYEEEGAVLANEAVHVTGLIVSAQFWPVFKSEELHLPEPVQAALEKYTKSFEMIKGNRTLEWQKHIGTVELEIEHKGSTLSLSVPPIQATIIWHFQEQEKWTIEDLAKAIGTNTTFLSNRIGFWVSKGLIIPCGQNTYCLAESLEESSQPSGSAPSKYVEEIDADSPMASTSAQRATELQVFWSYIEAMLTNLESLPLARIHSMLKLFATVECSSEELQKFLDEKVSQNLLIYSAGQYQLPK